MHVADENLQQQLNLGLPTYMMVQPQSVVPADIMSLSAFQSEEMVTQKYNPYVEIAVSGPKWSKEGG